MTEEILQTETEPNLIYPNSPSPTPEMIAPDPDIEPGIRYDKSPNLGFEPVELPRENLYGSDPGIDRLLLREAPDLIRRRITEAVEFGNLNKTLTHYESVIDSGFDYFSPDTFAGLKSLFDEGKQAQSKEAQSAWLLKFTTFLGGIRMEKRK
jgi:hypothetical protein